MALRGRVPPGLGTTSGAVALAQGGGWSPGVRSACCPLARIDFGRRLNPRASAGKSQSSTCAHEPSTSVSVSPFPGTLCRANFRNADCPAAFHISFQVFCFQGVPNSLLPTEPFSSWGVRWGAGEHDGNCVLPPPAPLLTPEAVIAAAYQSGFRLGRGRECTRLQRRPRSREKSVRGCSQAGPRCPPQP